ncbi:MAG: preprotein translocase subunit SecG [Halothiobacillaceae bacterium]
MTTLIIFVHVLLGLTLVGLVLIQHGKGADAGAAFGSGSSGTVFGARGATTFLQKLTSWLIAAFFGTSLLLAYVINASHDGGSVVDSRAPVEQADVPARPDQPADVPAPAAPGESTDDVPSSR